MNVKFNFPNEIWVYITDYCDIQSLSKLMICNKYFYNLLFPQLIKKINYKNVFKLILFDRIDILSILNEDVYRSKEIDYISFAVKNNKTNIAKYFIKNNINVILWELVISNQARFFIETNAINVAIMCKNYEIIDILVKKNIGFIDDESIDFIIETDDIKLFRKISHLYYQRYTFIEKAAKLNKLRLIKEAYKLGHKITISAIESTTNPEIYNWLINHYS